MSIKEDIEALRSLAGHGDPWTEPYFYNELGDDAPTILRVCDALEIAQRDIRLLEACNATGERAIEKQYFENKELTAKLEKANEASIERRLEKSEFYKQEAESAVHETTCHVLELKVELGALALEELRAASKEVIDTYTSTDHNSFMVALAALNKLL